MNNKLTQMEKDLIKIIAMYTPYKATYIEIIYNDMGKSLDKTLNVLQAAVATGTNPFELTSAIVKLLK